jgi:hypothetical protein
MPHILQFRIIYCAILCNLLKMLPLYLTKLMVNSYGIIGYILALNFIAFWGVAPCNLVD